VNVPDRFEWTRQPGIGPAPGVLGVLDGRTVVELGCGSGHNLAHLVAHRRARGIGIDHAPGKIERATRFYGHLPGIGFRLGDAASMLRTLTPGSIDVCLSIFGALSFADPGPILAAAARALRPGGLLALTLRADDHRDQVIVLSRKTEAEPCPSSTSSVTSMVS
jgi:SAM-dependent methyltransferase